MDLNAMLAQAMKAASVPVSRKAVAQQAAETWLATLETFTLEGYEAHVRRCTCKHCGEVTLDLAGVYEVRRHPRVPTTVDKRRMESLDTLVEGLDTVTVILDETAPACLSCVEEFGFAGVAGENVLEASPETGTFPMDDPEEDDNEEELDLEEEEEEDELEDLADDSIML